MTAATAISDFSTEPLNLSGTSGTVAFSMALEAEDTSATSNFEDTDIFVAELLLYDGTATTTVNLITPFEKNTPNNQLAGSPITPAYDPGVDEFNPAGSAVAVLLKNTFNLTYTIPDNIQTATLHLRARVDAATEFLRIRDVKWIASGPPGTADSDGDGVSDANEVLAGTDPNNGTSVFRVASLTSAGNTVTAGFATVTGKFYQGYTSTNLTQWTRDNSRAAATGDGTAATWPFAITAGTPARYYRIAVGASAAAFPATLP